MAFDEARSGSRGQRVARGKPATGASAFDSAASSSSSSSSAPGYASYQSGDTAYAMFRDGVERDLKKLTALVAATRTQVEKLGGKSDSSDLRKRM